MTPPARDPGVTSVTTWVDGPTVPRVVESALATAVSWVGYPLTPYVISEARPLLDLVTVGSLLGQPALTVPLLAPLYRVGLIAPDGSLVGNLWPWRSMSMDARRAAVDELAGLICLADDVAATLARLGSPIEPSWTGDRITLAALLAADVDLWQPPRLLTEALQPVTPYSAAPDGLSVRYRPGVQGAAEREAAGLRRAVVTRARAAVGLAPPQRLAYAGGGQRRPGAQQRGAELRRDALRAVLARYPGLEVADLLAGSGRHLDASARRLNSEMTARGLPALTRTDLRQAARTLRRDLAAIRTAISTDAV
ncbi:hypothetical protein [Frankia tisae]|uniref:hypothetical protein n=1 Tax=Frankia tisae TaxID=2950104 RepID=UPI0021BE430B|nr:hypothetical protein [Frankia tisae]